jgi:dolichol-phosphate mannosyltransferase
MSIAIIIPTYKETENIKILLKKIFQNISKAKVFIVDDSPDKGILSELRDFKNVNYIYRGQKMGRGSAVLAGMKEAFKSEHNKIFVEMDADLSHEPNEIGEKLTYFSLNSCAMLLSSRYLKKSNIKNWPVQRKIFSFFANKIAKFLLEVPVSDYTNGYRMYSRPATKHIILNCGKIGDGFIILSEILVELYYNNFLIKEIPSIFVNRTRGESSINLKEIIYSFLGLIKVYKLKKKLNS